MRLKSLHTFCLAQVLRANRANGVNLSFEELNLQVKQKLHHLKYNQTPILVGAKDRVAQQVPWYSPATPAKAGSGAKTRRK